MLGLRTRILFAVPLPIALMGLTACSSAPSGLQPGTPAFYWQAAKANMFKPMPLRKVSSDYLKLAETRALDFGETFPKFESASQDANIVLEFGYPSADMNDPQEMKKILFGNLPDETVQATVERKMLEKSIALTGCGAVGAANDPAKAQAAFQAGRPQVPREVFLLAMVNNLYDLAQLFGKKKLDLPQRVEFFAGAAKDALKQLKESKDSKTN